MFSRLYKRLIVFGLLTEVTCRHMLPHVQIHEKESYTFFWMVDYKKLENGVTLERNTRDHGGNRLTGRFWKKKGIKGLKKQVLGIQQTGIRIIYMHIRYVIKMCNLG